jgi:hypothetical protein
MCELKEALLPTIVFHHNYRHFDTIPYDRRWPDFAEPRPLVEITRIESRLKPNSTGVFLARQIESVSQDRDADALEHERGVDVDGNYHARRRLTKSDHTVVVLSDEDVAALNGPEVTAGSPIQQPPLDDVRRIMSSTECPNRSGVDLVNPSRIFWPGRADHDIESMHDDG